MLIKAFYYFKNYIIKFYFEKLCLTYCLNFYTFRSCYKVLIPHLVIRSDFDEVKSIANQIQEDWKSLLTDCFPKILVNILPYFAYEDTGDSGLAQQRETATKVYDMLKDENVLGKQVLLQLLPTFYSLIDLRCDFKILKLFIIYAVKFSIW